MKKNRAKVLCTKSRDYVRDMRYSYETPPHEIEGFMWDWTIDPDSGIGGFYVWTNSRRAGESARAIAETFGVPRSVVHLEPCF